jgi:hypothetical protein
MTAVAAAARSAAENLVRAGSVNGSAGAGSGVAPAGPREETRLTAHGNPTTVFRRAIDRDNLVAAELNARMLG